MAIIDSYRGIITVFVEFKTPKGNADEVLEVLKNIYHESAKGYEGLISVNYHSALDGTAIFNYAQWKDEASFDAFISDPKVQKSMQSLGEIDSHFTKTKVVFTS